MPVYSLQSPHCGARVAHTTDLDGLGLPVSTPRAGGSVHDVSQDVIVTLLEGE